MEKPVREVPEEKREKERFAAQPSNMKSHQVFISYSSKDVKTANLICDKIESQGYLCWIAPRNEQPGTSYGSQITKAIKSAEVVVLVYSANSNQSKHVLNEVSLAFDYDKKIIPIILDTSEMCADMLYYLSSTHHIRAIDNLSKGLEEMVYAIQGYIVNIIDEKNVTSSSQSGAVPDAPSVKRVFNSKLIMWSTVGVVILAIVVFLLLFIPKHYKSQLSAASNHQNRELLVGQSDTTDTMPVKAEEPQQVRTEPVHAERQTVMPTPSTGQPAANPKQTTTSGTVDLGFATYEGALRDGSPHGNGTMTFRTRHLIPGTVDCNALPGDKVVGTFREGKVNMGTWYHIDGTFTMVKLGQKAGE